MFAVEVGAREMNSTTSTWFMARGNCPKVYEFFVERRNYKTWSMKSRVSTKDNVRRIARNINELPKYEIETSFHSSLHTGSEYGYSVFFLFSFFFLQTLRKEIKTMKIVSECWVSIWSARRSRHFSKKTTPSTELITLFFSLSQIHRTSAAVPVALTRRREIFPRFIKNVNRTCNLPASTIFFVIASQMRAKARKNRK